MSGDISQKFSLWGLIRFSIPSVIMLIITSLYTAVDGVFVSRFVGSDALSAINIILPLDFILSGIAIMLGTGGSAIIGRLMGQGELKKARQNFTLITALGILIGFVFTGLCLSFLPQILAILGASERLIPYCLPYGKLLFLFASAYIVQVMFQSLFITAGKPNFALYITLISGILNVVFDYFFIVVCQMGISGAAWGTVLGRLIGAVLSLAYFLIVKGDLHFVKPVWDGHFVVQSLFNGSSEMVSSAASGATTFLFNITMMQLMGEDGVAAITIVLYSQFIFTAVFLGFANSVAPVFSYHYGGQNTPYLKKLFQHCIKIICFYTFSMILAAYFSASFVIGIFAPIGSAVFDIAYYGYHIFIWNFLFAGFNLFASSLFTAFSNGKTSALISFLRTFVFIVGFVLILPRFFGIDGLWLSIPAAEFCTFVIAVYLVKQGGKIYEYIA